MKAHRKTATPTQGRLSFGSAVKNLVASLGNLFVSAGETLGGIGRVSEEAEDLDAELVAIANVRTPKISKRRYVLGLELAPYGPLQTTLVGEPYTEVPPDEVAMLMARPQIPFRPEQILLDGKAAPYFNIYDIRVGRNSQLPATGEIPAIFFAHDAPSSIKLSCDLVQVSMEVAVLVRNKSSEPRTITAALVGSFDETGDNVIPLA